MITVTKNDKAAALTWEESLTLSSSLGLVGVVLLLLQSLLSFC